MNYNTLLFFNLRYKEPVFKDYAEKYSRILTISKDDSHERSLSQLYVHMRPVSKYNIVVSTNSQIKSRLIIAQKR